MELQSGSGGRTGDGSNKQAGSRSTDADRWIDTRAKWPPAARSSSSSDKRARRGDIGRPYGAATPGAQ
ncbi:hypothetical protein ACOMHN_026570 [Nucella lapillus]